MTSLLSHITVPIRLWWARRFRRRDCSEAAERYRRDQELIAKKWRQPDAPLKWREMIGREIDDVEEVVA
ncbi:MAG: hypothetical protein ACE5FA_01775 [Dehalococcoidia bacterium]